MISLIKAALVALRKGEELSHVETWKNVQAATAALVAVLGSVVVALRYFGVEVPVSDADLAAIASGAVALVGVVFAYLTPATTRKIGLPSKRKTPSRRKPRPEEAGDGHDLLNL